MPRRGANAAAILLLGAIPGGLASASAPQSGGVFLREYRYEPGLRHGNPRFDGRFRVNAPDVVLPGPALVVRTTSSGEGGRR